MLVSFEKYQGTGNDFIMIDNRNGQVSRHAIDVKKLCNRKFGIGADGLILIENSTGYDFEMVYFNSDGSQSFCGNGSRCAVQFCSTLGIIGMHTTFLSTDGVHTAIINNGLVYLDMHDVNSFEKDNEAVIINTGSPHFVIFCDSIDGISLIEDARKIRYSQKFEKEGINVNFAQPKADRINVRTYERGVEDETLSCGTGVTAVAIANHIKYAGEAGKFITKISTPGGELQVAFNFNQQSGYSNIKLIGPAEFVFSGSVEI